MTFIDSAQRSSELPALALTTPLASFAAGALFAVVTLAIAYLSQSFFALMNFKGKQRSKPAEVLQGLCIVSFSGSAFLFVVGIAKTGVALNPKFTMWSALGL